MCQQTIELTKIPNIAILATSPSTLFIKEYMQSNQSIEIATSIILN